MRAAEACQDAREGSADPPGADDADGPALHVEAEQSVEREVALADAGVGAMDAAVQCHDKGNGMLGDGVRRIVGHAGHGDAELPRRGEIDIVEARAAQGHQADALAGERVQHLGRQRIVHEGANGSGALGQCSGLVNQARFEIGQLMAGGRVGGVQEMPVVGLGAEDRDAHGARPAMPVPPLLSLLAVASRTLVLLHGLGPAAHRVLGDLPGRDTEGRLVLTVVGRALGSSWS